MEQIVVQIKDKDKVRLLADLLQALDFVASVQVTRKPNAKRTYKQRNQAEDFFAYAGIWADRDVSLSTLRSKACPRQQP